MSREYISCADTAKLIRQAIKEAFPASNSLFVRMSIPAALRLPSNGWTARTNNKSKPLPPVSRRPILTARLTSKARSSTCSTASRFASAPTRSAATARTLMRRVERAISRLIALAENFERDGIACPTVAQYRNGELFNLQLSGLHTGSNTQTVQQDIRAALYKSSDRLAEDQQDRRAAFSPPTTTGIAVPAGPALPLSPSILSMSKELPKMLNQLGPDFGASAAPSALVCRGCRRHLV